MKPLADILPQLTAPSIAATIPETQPPAPTMNVKPSSPVVKPLVKPPQWETLSLKDSPQAQDELTRLLSQTFASQKTYGDKAQMMEFRDGMFQLVLANYSFARIREAFIEHVRRNPDLPTPSDIVNHIDPPKPALSAVTYAMLRRKIEHEGYYPLSDEKRFMRAFEAQELAKAGA